MIVREVGASSSALPTFIDSMLFFDRNSEVPSVA